ncbi:MAG: hypothetical protein ACYSYM_02455 [Planctomycetota bacterium]|jgi:hypothetical protein
MKKNMLIASLTLLAVVLSGCGVPEVYVDVKPQSCPNPFNVNSKGLLPVAVLGTEDFDVTSVDPSAVTLLGVPPITWDYEDVSTPLGEDPEPCECTEAGPDGYLDVVFHFDTQEVVAAMETLADAFEELQVEDGELMPVLLFEGDVPDPDDEDTWNDMDRWGGDCVVIRKKGQ